MSKKITTELHILANVEQAEVSLKGLEKSIENLWGKGAAPKSFSNGIDALTNKLFSLKNATDESFRIDETALKQAGRDYKKLAERIDALTISLSSMSEEQKRSLLSDKEKKAWEERVEAVKKYNKELKRSEELAAEKAALEVKKKTLIGQKSALVKPILGERGQRVQDYDKLAAEKAIAEKVVKDWRDKGKSETSGRENDFTRAQKNIREVEQKMAQMGLTPEDINAGRKELADYTEGVKDFDSKIAGLDKNIDELTDKINSIVPDGADTKLAALKEKLSSLGVEGVKDAKTFADVEKALNDFDKKALEPVEVEIENATQYLAKMKKEAKAMGERVDESTESLKKETQAAADTKAFEDRIKAFLGVSGAVKVLHSAIRDALATIKELDATMTEMAVVTDLSVGDYWDQLPEYSQRASELGVSINDAYKSATLYYQQGLKTNEVNAISVETLKMAKIANMDAADATDKMTAALRGFNMELNEASAKKVADVYSELAAITAADTQEIANAMTKTASIASSAGMEFETTAAFLSQIIETTRESAETAGTAMKTVIARFQELKKAPDEIGEVDGEVVDANAIETALRKVGVSLRDTNGQFRDLDDVFLELSSKWDGLDKNTQRYIATIAAGSRQQSRFIAMMSNYSRTQELVTSANNSAGASQEQFNKTLEGLKAKLEKLKNAWHEFTMGIMNSDLVKLGVDIVTKFLETINKATSAFDGLGGSIVKILSILTVFKVGKTIFEKMKEPMISFFAEIVKKAGETGEAAGDAAKEGLERSKKKAEKKDNKEMAKKRDWLGLESFKKSKDLLNGKVKEKNANAKAKKTELEQWQGSLLASEENLQSLNTNRQLELTNNQQLNNNIQNKTDYIKKLKEERNSAQTNNDNATYKIKKKEIDSAYRELDEYEKKLIDSNEKIQQIEEETKNEKQKQLEINNKLYEAEEAYDKAQAELYEAQRERLKKSEEGYAVLSSGVKQFGEDITGAGVAVSMFGGLLSSLGLEEEGQFFANIGNFAILAGSAISGLGPVIIGIVAKLVEGGMTASMAWVWVTVVAAAIVGLGFAIVVIAKSIQASSPEGKLKAAEEAANSAAEAADRAAESYGNLKNSLDALDNKYDFLEDLTRGTKEWNEAVQEINDSVLSLISDYPELAQFVQNKGGVLTIDIDSAGVQQVLKDAESAKITTNNASLLAQNRLFKAQTAKQFSDMEAIKAASTARGNDVFKNWLGGGFATGAGIGAAVGGIGGGVLGGPAAALLLGGVGTIAGTVAGGVVGAIGGAIAGPIAAAGVETDKALQEATENLALSIAEGETKTEFDEMFKFLTESGVVEDEARAMAESFAKNNEELVKFGASLKEENIQSKARYEAMATQAEQLAKLSGWTTEEIVRGQNLIDGDIYQEFEKQATEEIENIDLEKTNNLNSLVGEDKRLLDEAIQQIYGENAYRKGDQVVFVDENGTTQTEKLALRKDQITDTMKSIKATELAASAMEKSREVINELDKTTNGAMSKLYNDIGGGQLTQSDLQSFMGENAKEIWDNLSSEGQSSFGGDFEKFQVKLISNKAKELWEGLSEEERNVFGNNFETFEKDFEGVIEATKSFNDIREKLQSFDKELDIDKLLDPNKVSRDTAIGLEKQISTIIERLQIQGKDIKAEGGIIDIADQYLTIMDKVNADLQDDFAAQFAALDLTDLDALNKFRYDLIHTYQIEEGEVDNLINTITEATLAISATILEISNYGPLQEAQQKTAKLIEEMTELQWQYNEAIRMSGNNLQELTKKLQENLRQQINASTEAYRESQTNLAKIYAQGANQANGTDFRDYVTLDESGGYTVDYEKLNRDRGSIDQEAFDKWFESFSKTYDQMLGYEESARASYNELVKLQTDSKEAYQELRDMAKEAVLDKMQKQLELQEETLDATKQANSQLINKLQEQINEDRQARQNEDAEKNLLDMQSKLAYLSMDTSGANDLAKLESQRQIEQAERQYQDSLVDQALQNLQDANAKAEEQRERQISLADRQLEAYQNSSQFQEDIDRLMQEALAAEDIMKSDLGALLTEMKTGGLSEQEKTDWQNELKVLGVGASSWISTDWGKMLSEEKAKIDNISDTINVIATSQNLKILNQRKDLVAKGFDLDEINSIEDEKQLDKLTAFISREGDKDSIGSYSSQLDSSGVNYKSQQEYYDDILNQSYSKEFNPNDTQTYEQYLSSKASNSKQDISRSERTKLVDQAAVLLSQGFSTGTADYQKLLADYFKAGGTGDQWVEELAQKNANIISSSRVLGQATGWNNSPAGDWDENISVIIGGQPFKNLMAYAPDSWNGKGLADEDKDLSNDKMAKALGIDKNNTPLGSVVLYKEDPYILQYRNGKGRIWTKLHTNTNTVASDLAEAMKKQVAFKTGGLADFTGPAWLDGTKSKPEIVLNQQDSANFLMLRDVLSEVLHGSTTLNNSNTNTSGDNHFEIEINVEKLENDYDVEQLADKVRRMIYDDASYRNVNAVGFIR